MVSFKVNTMRILIVDDDYLSAELTAECLMLDSNISVQIAGDGASALRAVSEFAPDAILLDVQLPDGSGLDLAAQLKELSPNPDTRILILSGNVRHDFEFEQPEVVSAWLEKPVDIDTLQDHIWRKSGPH